MQKIQRLIKPRNYPLGDTEIVWEEDVNELENQLTEAENKLSQKTYTAFDVIIGQKQAEKEIEKDKK